MSGEFEFDDNDDIFSNVEFPEENLSDTLTQIHSENHQPDSPKPSVENQLLTKPTGRHDSGSSSELNKKLNKSRPFLEDCSPVKRLFPGPAGIFLNGSQTEPNDNLFCTQATFSMFQDGGAWAEMCKDLSLGPNTPLCDRFNIEWIKKVASQNMFFNDKAPFLAGVIQSLEVVGVQKKTVNVTLRDVTGTIQGMIEHNLYKDYASHLTLGAVLVLSNFTVLCCTCNKCDNFHLAITRNNLCTIYGRKKIELHKIQAQQILTEYYKKLNEQKSIKKENLDVKRQTIPNQNKNNKTNTYSCRDSVQNTSRYIKNINAPCKSTFEQPNKPATTTRNDNKYEYSIPECVSTSLDENFPTVSPILSNIKRFKNSVPTKDIRLTTTSTENVKGSEDGQNTDNKRTRFNNSENILKIGNNKISVTFDKIEEKEIWENALEGFDMESFLEDF